MSTRRAFLLEARRIVTALAAYLMVFHVVAASAMADAPTTAGSGFFVICSLHAGGPADPGPSDQGAQHLCCDLCCLCCSAAAASPSSTFLLVQFASASVVSLPDNVTVVAPVQTLTASRPRGPPRTV